MRPGVEPHHVSDVKPFQPSTLTCLEEQPPGAFAGVSKNGKAGWIFRGALLEVFAVSSSKRLAAWHFGRILSDEHTNVTCVEEFGVGQTLKLLVGVCNASPVGLLCLFDVSVSKVIKAVEIPHPVTEIEVVSTHTGNQAPRWALSEHLCYFCGLVAVGTNTGKVFLVDMCTDDSEFFSDEEIPSRLHFISPRIRDIENQRFHCMSQGLHLAMTLNESMINRNGFEYQKPDGLVMKTFRTDCVTVSCLKYIPQTGLLVVGFSFGCYQLWKLNIPVLEYSSRLEPDPMPVTHITYQEPENDPKNFCYIWIARGQKENEDQALDSVSSISMYQLAFNQKTFYSSYGVYYEELMSVCLRLDHELTPKLVQFGTNYDGGSRVVSCYTLSDPNYRAPTKLDENESFEESNHGPDLSLCVFVWEATEGNLASKVGRHLAIFDINRWYHAQMPSSVRYAHGSTDTCAYFCSCRLDQAAEKADNDSLLMAHVGADSLRKFISNSLVPPDQYFYPASLAFSASLVFETGIVKAEFLGSQRQVLASMETKGPAILVQPLDLYNMCVHVGLLPRPVDAMTSTSNMAAKRVLLLGLALEYNMVKFLRSCITTWAGGEYENHSCTLKFLLDWAWELVSTTKHKIDSICVTLYNWSGLNLDQRSLQTLVLCNQRLAHLVSLFKTFLTQTGPITQQGETELQSKILVTSLLSQHLSVVLWFVGAGLLPEDDDTEVTLGGLYCYPATSLMTAYKNRRTELQNIHSDVDETSMLMIDGLVETMGVKDVWEREGGTGLYPPPSLHALLSSYLLESCDMFSKHCLVLYLLLDLVSVDSSDENETFSEKVSGFARRFNLPPTLVKLIQGFWLLDHRDFEEALSLILDPMVRSEFSRWQHKRIIKALLYQGDSKMALRYINSVKPALTTQEEVKLKLTVLLANQLTSEALQYQRVCRDKNNMQDLLHHLFLGCQQTKTVGRLLELPLTSEEETTLVDYLLGSSEPHSQELLVMHYLQRARFVEAIQLNEKLKHSIFTEMSSKARERAAARNAIVDSYASILPEVQRRLMFEQVHVPKKNVQWRREVRRPTPLSTNVTKNKAKVMSQSAFIMTIMEKLDEIEPEQPQTEMLDRSVGPFIGTPVTPARRSQRDTPATVYPESVGNLSTSAGLTLNKSLNIFNSADTPTKGDNRLVSASCLSMLQTPPVKRVTPRKQKLSSTNMVTPQSILKVRNMIATTSPSPHSSNTTPNSQELEGSSKKLPRKLGYGAGTTPLSSIPRHLAGDRSLPTSQASSPKSVSFLEPSSPEVQPVISPRQSRASQPTTPKSVSFMDKSMPSGSKLPTLSTPKQLRFAQSETSVLQGSSKLGSPKSPTQESPRSVKDRSPTPESSERSPKFAASLDQLQRRPLHTPPKDQEGLVETKERTPSPAKEDDLVLRLEESDENISDEEVEEMDESYRSGVASSASGDVSISSVATVRERIEQQVSPSALSPQNSPTKYPSSPTVKVSKSPVSVFTSSAEHVQSEITSAEPAETGSVSEPTVAQNIHIDLTAEDEMEVDQSEKDVDQVDEIDVKKTTEIFEEYEEINPPAEIEEMETVSSSADVLPLNQSVKQEVVEEGFTAPPEPVRQLEPPAPPEPVGQIESFSSPADSEDQGTPLPLKNLSPQQEKSPVIKTKDSPPDSDYGVQSSSAEKDVIDKSPSAYINKIMTEINDKFGESPVNEENNVKFRAKLESEDETIEHKKTTRTRRKFDISPVKIEQEPTTPTRRTRQQEAELSAPTEAPVTPTRSSRRTKKIGSDEDEVPQEVLTPSRSTRGRRKKEVEASPSRQQEPVTPTRSLRNRSKKEAETPTREVQPPEESVTPGRSSRRKNVKTEEKPEVKLAKVEAKSPKPFSPKAREAVQESLLQISEELKEKMSTPPGKMTKIKDKAGGSPVRTPTRSRRDNKEELTPSRRSSRLASRSEDTDNDENSPVTPGRSGRSQKASVQSKKVATPKRGQKKTEDVEINSPDRNENNNKSVLPSEEEIEVAQSAQIKRTPTRGRRKQEESFIEVISTVEAKTPPRKLKGGKENIDESRKDSFGSSEIPLDFEVSGSVETTPSRRQSLSRSCKKGIPDTDLEKTPTRSGKVTTRRQSLGHGTTINEEIISVKTPTRRQSLAPGSKLNDEKVSVKTPTRTVGRSDKLKNETIIEEDAIDDIQPEQTEKQIPSRRGRSKKTEESVTNTENIKVKTPSRRGRAKKVQTESEEEILDSKTESGDEKMAVPKTKRRKQDEGSPAAHTRSHDTGVYDIQSSSSFQFSDPMEVDTADPAVVKPFTPVKSFIFSPPISHTRSVVKEETDEGILLPPGQSVKQVTEDLDSKPEKKPKRKTKKLYKEREEILLISPVTQGEGDSGEEGRGIMTRSTRAASKKVQTKKDGTKLLLQSFTGLGRKTRTSHRFGPVGQKKSEK